MSTAALGRADLIRAFLADGEQGLDAIADILDYEKQEKEGGLAARLAPPKLPPDFDVAERVATGLAEEPDQRRISAPVAGDQRREFLPTPFWYAHRLTPITSVDAAEREPPQDRADVLPIGARGLGRFEGVPPDFEPLVADSRLFPALRGRLDSSFLSRRVDVPALADQWSRGRIVDRLLFRPMAAWAPTIFVLIDRSLHLIPIWDDQDRLVDELCRRLGESTILECVYFEADEPRPWRDENGAMHEYPPVDPGARVLVVSDLGFYGGSRAKAHWRLLREHFSRLRVEPTALVPCPANRWDHESARRWNAIDWERPRRAPHYGVSPDLKTRTRRLASLISFAARVEPGLLRAVRRLLPVQEADVGTEIDVWALMNGDFAPGASLSGATRAEFQESFSLLEPELKKRVVQTIRRWRDGTPKEIWFDELLGLSAGGELPCGVLDEAEEASAREMVARMAASVGLDEMPGIGPAITQFVSRSLKERHPEILWQDKALQEPLWKLWNFVWEGRPPFPGGVGPEILGEEGDLKRWEIRYGQTPFQILPAGSTYGSPLASFDSGRQVVKLRCEGEIRGEQHELGSGVVRLGQPSKKEAGLIVRSDHHRLVLRPMERPEWASAMGRDVIGLWLTFEIDGVEQLMRYIPPGQFMMGSPKDEPGRFDDEKQRLATITEGFWLAETPCTQALWEVVMGENPSLFKTPDRPVERIGWDECSSFYEKLEELLPGFMGRLPTEVEWEYACRAGTETATYAGSMEILGERNAPILDEIAWYGGNSGRDFELPNGADSVGWANKQYGHSKAGTHPIKRKLANSWGLYDMLGNVREWCFSETSSDRVHRGGCWYDQARCVRAAFRRHRVVSDHYDPSGFRLARSQGYSEQDDRS